MRLGRRTRSKSTSYIQPGHHAEILGDERFVGFEFQPKAAEEFAR